MRPTHLHGQETYMSPPDQCETALRMGAKIPLKKTCKLGFGKKEKSIRYINAELESWCISLRLMEQGTSWSLDSLV